MPFNGPGRYEIVPYIAPSLSLTAQNGGPAPNQVIKTSERYKPPFIHAIWAVVLLRGSGDDAEYMIINDRSGYYIMCTDEKTIVAARPSSPNDPRAIWKIKEAVTNGYDVWTITSKSEYGQLNLRGGSSDPMTDVISYPVTNADNCKFYFDPAGAFTDPERPE